MSRGRTRRYRGHGLIIAALGVTLISGCVASHLDPVPAPATDLSGQWVLDPAASDDATAMITKALPVPRKPRPGEYADPGALAPTSDGGRSGGGRRGGGGRSDASSVSQPDVAPSWGKVTPRDFVAAFALPAHRVDITQSAGRLVVAADARRREFVPGDETPFSTVDRYGSRRVKAGWRGVAFEIQSEDGARLHVTEDFRRQAGDQLALQVEFKARGIKTLTIHSIYRRASASDLERRDEGPPVPAPR